MAAVEDWEGATVETPEVKLENDPTGKPIILKRFHFKFPPDIEKFPTRKELREHHLSHIDRFLFIHDLLLIEDLRVNIDKVEKTYDIFATCQPKKGTTLKEKPKTLQDVITGHAQP